jgi:hypothetical protein
LVHLRAIFRDTASQSRSWHASGYMFSYWIGSYCKLAKRTVSTSRWLIASSAILSLLGYTTHWGCFFNTHLNIEVLALYFGLQKLTALQLTQCAIPIALCYWLVRKHRKSGGGEHRHAILEPKMSVPWLDPPSRRLLLSPDPIPQSPVPYFGNCCGGKTTPKLTM